MVEVTIGIFFLKWKAGSIGIRHSGLRLLAPLFQLIQFSLFCRIDVSTFKCYIL